MDVTSIRRQQLEEGIRKDLDLLKKYEDKLRLSDDPKEQARCQEEIARLGASVNERQAELESLRIPDSLVLVSSEAQSTSKWRTVNSQHLYARILSLEEPDPIWLLGAGASWGSGIPLSGELVERGAKWTYCRVHRRSPEDTTITRSDWLPWLHGHTWYNPSQPPEAQYVTALDHLLHPAEERRQFFRRFSRSSIPASKGYRRLLNLMAVRHVLTVLTTNFDTVLSDLSLTVPNPRDVTTIYSPSNYHRISTAPTYPPIIYLFGNAEWYADHYFDEAYQRLDNTLVEHLIPLLRDHPLIVVGYSGSEESVMHHLFLNNIEALHHLRCGLYWCVLESEFPQRLDPLVSHLADVVGSNFCFVPIQGFDEMLLEFWQMLETDPSGITVPAPASTTREPPTFDLHLMAESTLDDLDWLAVQHYLVEYCREMRIAVPSPVTRDWLAVQMQAQGLATDDAGTLRPTMAGVLFFAPDLSSQLPNARLEVHVAGEEPRTFAGNLWQQLAVIDLIESEFNVPFRLKGPKSETVTPFPSLALKELIVNALAHRRYDGDDNEAIVIRIEPDYINITNPGGLFEEVRRQLPEGIPPEEVLGTQPVKGYRNPVIADFFYGSGEMDKLGSGLPDVRKWARQNEGDVVFRLGPDDASFEVTLYRRPERPSDETGAASPLTPVGEFTSNVLEVTELPDRVWSDRTTYSWAPQILKETQDRNLPAFVLYDKRLYTFTDLSQTDNPLRQFIEESDVRSVPLSVFATGEVGRRRLVHLLNEALRVFVESQELIFDWKRKRAYFSRTSEGERSITYQARLRKATRTVVKARVSPTTNEVTYWEHQAVFFRFKCFGDVWGLQLLPTYVFTFDGYYARLPGQRSGPLATRRLSREYNVHVDSHLVFWTVTLSDGNSYINLEDRFGSRITLSRSPSSHTLQELEAQVESDESPLLSEDDLDEMEEHLAELNGDDWEDNEPDN